MKGMSPRTTYFFKGQTYEPNKHTTEPDEQTAEPVVNGNRFATARIIRPKIQVVPMNEELKCKVTGWDMQMNTIRRIANSMDEAVELACTLLHARIKPLSNK